MRQLTLIFVFMLLGACSVPSFVTDAEAIPVSTKIPDHFELPARFALVRTVYGNTQAAPGQEVDIWEDLANRHGDLGSFTPLVAAARNTRYASTGKLVETARIQRYNYVLLVEMFPASGSADVTLLHTGSGGVMATAQAVSPNAGRRGFWGGQIYNPRRLDRATLKIAQATAPVIEKMLSGMVERQRQGF